MLAVGVCVSSTHALTGTISCFGSSAASRICLSLLWKVVLAIPFSSHHALIVFPLPRYSRYISVHASSLTRFFASLILFSSINSHLVQPSPGTFWDFVALYGYCSTFRVICIAVGLVGGYRKSAYSTQKVHHILSAKGTKSPNVQALGLIFLPVILCTGPCNCL